MVQYGALQAFQVLGWIVAVIASYRFRELVAGGAQAWNYIFAGTFLIFVRTIIPFTGFTSNPEIAVITHIIGAVSVVLLTKGIMDYYIVARETVG